MRDSVPSERYSPVCNDCVNGKPRTMVMFKMRDSVPSEGYSPVCNVLRQWKTSLIPTYRVYRLYDMGKALDIAQVHTVQQQMYR